MAVLGAFVKVVDRGSFTAAADELGIRQSTISKWLSALEDEIGVPLLDRTTRATRVTDEGRLFYERAVAIVGSYDDAIAEVRGDQVIGGRIRVSLPVVFGRLFLVDPIAVFLRQHPGIEIEMVFADRYVSLVEEGFDLCVRVGVQLDSTLRSHALGESRRVLVAAPAYLESRGAPRTPAELADHECIRHTELSTRTVWSFRRGGETEKLAVSGRVSCNSSEASLELARGGLGVALLAAWLVDADVRAGRLVPLLDGYELPCAPIRALTPPGRHLAPRVRALIDHFAATVDVAGFPCGNKS